MSLDNTPADLLLGQVAERLPELEALHIIILMAQYDNEMLTAATPLLASFTSLKYITFMTGGVTATTDDELSVAKRWAKACPTLRTIILPKGKVWFQRDGTWACCD